MDEETKDANNYNIRSGSKDVGKHAMKTLVCSTWHIVDQV